MTDALRASLEQFLQQQLAPRVTVAELTSISDGWETEVYRFVLEGRGTPETLILRMYPGQDAIYKCPREFHGMKTLYELGYPVPEVLLHTIDPHITGKPFLIMRYIAGQPPGLLMQTGEPETRDRMLRQYVELMVKLHTLDAAPFLPDALPKPDDPYAFIRAKVAFFRANILEQHQRREFQTVLAWLEAQIEQVPCARLSITHNDFHPFNILWSDAENRAWVIDWGSIEAADFRYDLGWSLLLAETYGEPGQREAVLAEYEAVRGEKVEQIAVFEVMAALRRLFSVVMSLSAGADALGMRPEAVETMRQQSGHLRAVYGVIMRHTGLTLPEIERWLEAL